MDFSHQNCLYLTSLFILKRTFHQHTLYHVNVMLVLDIKIKHLSYIFEPSPELIHWVLITLLYGQGSIIQVCQINKQKGYRLGKTIDFSLFVFVKFTNFKPFKHSSNELRYAKKYFLHQVHSIFLTTYHYVI